MKNRTIIAAVVVAGLVAGLAVLGASADATPTPPPLSEQPAQPTAEHHVSPSQCTVSATVVGNVCAEYGERWLCPAALDPSAVHRGELTYAETVSPTPPPTRWSHCLFVKVEQAFPHAPSDPLRPLVDCLEQYLNGAVVVDQCQTAAAPAPVPSPSPTPIPSEPCPIGFEPLPSDTYVGTTVCVPQSQPPIGFTG